MNKKSNEINSNKNTPNNIIETFYSTLHKEQSITELGNQVSSEIEKNIVKPLIEGQKDLKATSDKKNTPVPKLELNQLIPVKFTLATTPDTTSSPKKKQQKENIKPPEKTIDTTITIDKSKPQKKAGVLLQKTIVQQIKSIKQNPVIKTTRPITSTFTKETTLKNEKQKKPPQAPTTTTTTTTNPKKQQQNKLNLNVQSGKDLDKKLKDRQEKIKSIYNKNKGNIT
jgi:hypothetical protein